MYVNEYDFIKGCHVYTSPFMWSSPTSFHPFQKISTELTKFFDL